MTHRIVSALPLLILATLAFAPSGCDSSSANDDSFEVTYDPVFDPSSMQADVTHSYYPLPVGAVWRYRAETEDGEETVVIEVLDETRVVAGATARVVHAREFLEGELIEDTFDWFAQDDDGNVWYLGEETTEYEDGEPVTTAGSWEAGVDGAEAGIIMPAVPTVGQAYYQEFYEGEAEDRGRVLALNETVAVPFGSFTDCVKTEDTTPLEPNVVEHKYYCPDVGTVLEVDFEDDERVELVIFELPDGP